MSILTPDQRDDRKCRIYHARKAFKMLNASIFWRGLANTDGNRSEMRWFALRWRDYAGIPASREAWTAKRGSSLHLHK